MYFFQKLITFQSVITYVYLFDRPPLPLPLSCLQVVCGVLEFLNKCKHRYGFEGNNLLFSVKICLWLVASMDRPSGCFLALSEWRHILFSPCFKSGGVSTGARMEREGGRASSLTTRGQPDSADDASVGGIIISPSSVSAFVSFEWMLAAGGLTRKHTQC